ncbi:hypothetical protein, partial [Heyndrickxia sporothermodurans]
AVLMSTGTPEMLRIDRDALEHSLDAPVLLEVLASIHEKASVDVATDLLETTSATALELPSIGAAEVAPTAALDLGRDESASFGDAQPGSLLADAPAATNCISSVDQSAVEGGDRRLPVTTHPMSLRDAQLQPAEPPQGRAVSHTWLPASLTFVQTVFQMNMMAWSYAHGESEAALAHLRALSHARTPFQAIDLQAREMTRSLDAAVRLGEALAAPSRQLLTG